MFLNRLLRLTGCGPRLRLSTHLSADYLGSHRPLVRSSANTQAVEQFQMSRNGGGIFSMTDINF